MKFITFNTWKCDGDYTRRIDLMCRYLYNHQVDFILLQESFKSEDNKYNTSKQLANHLSLSETFFPARLKSRTVSDHTIASYSGLAILSRHPVTDTGILSLPDDNEDGERIAGWATYEVDKNPVLVINTHLSHLVHREDLRQKQLSYIIKFAKPYAESHTIILGGDMNSTPTRDALVWLANQNDISASNAWHARSTVEFPNTLVTREEDSCIDHLYLLGSFTKQQWREVKVILDQPHNGIYPSDHTGILATLE